MLVLRRQSCSSITARASSSLAFSSSATVPSDEERRPGGRHPYTVSVFWDLDNKPPVSVPPYDAALRLRQVAMGFGRLVDMVAYANRHAFSYLPSWVREERRRRKELDLLEARGLSVSAEPYTCGYCGRKCATNMALKKHFKELHERERAKRMRRLESLKGKRKEKYRDSLAAKEAKYRDAAQGIIMPKVGYGLMQELKRAGVWVRMVSDKPEAADEALKRHIQQSICDGIQCICLVSDDSDFTPVLEHAQARKLRTVVVGDRPVLKRHADICFSWAELASGRAFDRACRMSSVWYPKQGHDGKRASLEAGHGIVGSGSPVFRDLETLCSDSSEDTDVESEGIDGDAGWWLDADVNYDDGW